MDFPPEMFKAIAENIVLFGGAIMALFYGVKRIYGLARNVEKLVDSAEEAKRTQEETTRHAILMRAEIKADLERHIELEEQKFIKISSAVDSLTGELRARVKMEEDRDAIRDNQLIKLTDHMDEVISEMRPNGGSSMKDIMNATKDQVTDIHTRVSILETKRGIQTKPLPHRKAKKKTISRKRVVARKRK